MPGISFRQSKTKRGAAASSASKANVRAVINAIQSDSTIFARVDKSLGNSNFRLTLNDGSPCQGTPRGLFTSRNMRITLGDIVILETSTSSTHEIIGLLSKEESATLYKNKRLSKHLCGEGEEDTLFDYSAEVNVDSV